MSRAAETDEAAPRGRGAAQDQLPTAKPTAAATEGAS